MTWTCSRVRGCFSERIDGPLPAAEEAEVLRHLEECGACARVWQRFAESLSALRAAAPPLPDGMADRVRAALSSEDRSPRPAPPSLSPRWLWPSLAAVLLLAVIALFLRGHRPAGVAVTNTAASCVDPLFDLWQVDVRGLRAPLPTEVRSRPLDVGGSTVAIPTALLSRGPYRAGFAEARQTGEATCVPLLAAYGDVLVLTIARPTAASPASGIRAVADARRVSYARVAWTHGGRLWGLEGRAPVADLVALAHELEARAPHGGG